MACVEFAVESKPLTIGVKYSWFSKIPNPLHVVGIGNKYLVDVNHRPTWLIGMEVLPPNVGRLKGGVRDFAALLRNDLEYIRSFFLTFVRKHVEGAFTPTCKACEMFTTRVGLGFKSRTSGFSYEERKRFVVPVLNKVAWLDDDLRHNYDHERAFPRIAAFNEDGGLFPGDALPKYESCLVPSRNADDDAARSCSCVWRPELGGTERRDASAYVAKLEAPEENKARLDAIAKRMASFDETCPCVEIRTYTVPDPDGGEFDEITEFTDECLIAEDAIDDCTSAFPDFFGLEDDLPASEGMGRARREQKSLFTRGLGSITSALSSLKEGVQSYLGGDARRVRKNPRWVSGILQSLEQPGEMHEKIEAVKARDDFANGMPSGFRVKGGPVTADEAYAALYTRKLAIAIATVVASQGDVRACYFPNLALVNDPQGSADLDAIYDFMTEKQGYMELWRQILDVRPKDEDRQGPPGEYLKAVKASMCRERLKCSS